MFEAKKNTIKSMLILVWCFIYTATDMYNKMNLFILIIIAIVCSLAIHYIVDFIFNQIDQF